MKLRNKKTGEIGWLYCDHISIPKKMTVFSEDKDLSANHWDYKSLAELNAEWEDYEEPKEYWHIFGTNITKTQEGLDKLYDERNKEIGNYFDTKEEAEKAVEKLKAMAKLKEFGFRFIDWELDMKAVADGKIWFDVGINTEWDAERLLELKPEVKKSLDILFGGEE